MKDARPLLVQLTRAVETLHESAITAIVRAIRGEGLAAEAVETLLRHAADAHEVWLRARKTDPPDLGFARLGALPEISVHVMANFGEDATPALKRALSNSRGTVRALAAWALSLLGPPGAETTRLLVDACRDEDEFVRERAASAMGAFSRCGEQSMQCLVEKLVDNSISVRIAAARSLGQIGASVQEALPELVQALRDNNCAEWADREEVHDLRLSIAEAVWKIARKPEDVIVSVTNVLRESNSMITKLRALLLFEEMGSGATTAIPVIVESSLHAELMRAAQKTLQAVRKSKEG